VRPRGAKCRRGACVRVHNTIRVGGREKRCHFDLCGGPGVAARCLMGHVLHCYCALRNGRGRCLSTQPPRGLPRVLGLFKFNKLTATSLTSNLKVQTAANLCGPNRAQVRLPAYIASGHRVTPVVLFFMCIHHVQPTCGRQSMTTASDHTALVDELIALVGAGPPTLAARLRDLKSSGQPLADILNSLSVRAPCSLDALCQLPGSSGRRGVGDDPGLIMIPCPPRRCHACRTCPARPPTVTSPRRPSCCIRLPFVAETWRVQACCLQQVLRQTPKM
jgi:hypothetical protein